MKYANEIWFMSEGFELNSETETKYKTCSETCRRGSVRLRIRWSGPDLPPVCSCSGRRLRVFVLWRRQQELRLKDSSEAEEIHFSCTFTDFSATCWDEKSDWKGKSYMWRRQHAQKVQNEQMFTFKTRMWTQLSIRWSDVCIYLFHIYLDWFRLCPCVNFQGDI